MGITCPLDSYPLQVSLDFTELSQFKHLVHLSLVVLKATDSQLKDYLVDRLVTLRKKKEVVEGELREAAGNLQESGGLPESVGGKFLQLIRRHK